MTETASIPQTPQEAAEQITETFKTAAKDFETMKFDTNVPESVRALAEKTVTQTRDAYERGKESLEESIDAVERSFDAAGQGATDRDSDRSGNLGCFFRARRLAERVTLHPH